jgi:exodeoxyribonuclease VII large subunit
MTNLSSNLSTQSTQQALSISELTARIRGVLEPQLSSVWVQGEVSNFKPAPSGHAYFSLKDAQSTVAAAIFGWGKRSQTFQIRDGQQVLCRGRISVYPPRGSYQLIIDVIEPLGAGALQLAFEQLKQKLGAEGLFSADRKRPLPEYPTRVAIVTSPTGAAIQDMLNVLGRRAPHVEINIVPALVQGSEAPAQIVRALERANSLKLGEVIIVARGGGSLEDLWAFNHESLARAIASSALPVISGVGHEVDFTIADFVADLRAPTPSAAAEIVSRNWVDFPRRLEEQRDRMRHSALRGIQLRRERLRAAAALLVSPKDRLREQAQRLDEMTLRLQRSIERRLETRKLRLGQSAEKLQALSPLGVLNRGYAIAFRDEKEFQIVRSAHILKSGDRFGIRFHDGDVQVETL